VRLAVTGAGGFLGWHVRCKAFTLGIDCVPVPRTVLTDVDRLASLIGGVDAVLHCAGVNRGTDREVTEGNLLAAHQLAAAMQRAGRPIRVVNANSTLSRGDTSYGIAKRKAAELLASASFSDVILPNLFGEHGRPHYNSFVATFCHELAGARAPVVTENREIPLLHVQEAADILIQEASATGCRVVEPEAEPFLVSAVLDLLKNFALVYATGEIPDISDRFRARLFNTYRSHLFPGRYPIEAQQRTDPRGTLVECVRAGTTGGQAFISSTVPAARRGEHVHLR
jgi:UDP-2-acetamido-2,6-beta-L-arabino-hexul-4-ose reductase